MIGFIKSPLNYTGNKFQVIADIVDKFPIEGSTFYDVFSGGLTVGFNVGLNLKYDKIVAIDNCQQIIDLFKYFYNNSTTEILQNIDEVIDYYGLSKTNSEAYLQLRNDYNLNPSDVKFYTLICYAFSNQIRFNKKGEFNMPFGKERSSFNPVLRKRLKGFCNILQKLNMDFISLDFHDFFDTYIDKNEFSSNDIVYCDPPRYDSSATSYETKVWTAQMEQDLLNYLDKLNEMNIKFVLSNNLKCENPYLKEWIQKYNINYLSADYSSCSYNKKNKEKDREILVTNF